MERKNILTAQKEIVKNSWKDEFTTSGSNTFVYYGDISAKTYCAFLQLDYNTLARLGDITYNISYVKEVKEGEELFLLMCTTFIDSAVNDKLSIVLEASEDWLGLFSTKQSECGARWLPANWKELMSDEQKEEIAVEWCKNNSAKLEQYLDDYDKEKIAYDYIENNPNEVADNAFSKLSDPKDFIKECIDNL